MGPFFFAAQFLWPQHFLHGISEIYMDQFMYLIIKRLKKLISKVFWITIIANFFKK